MTAPVAGPGPSSNVRAARGAAAGPWWGGDRPVQRVARTERGPRGEPSRARRGWRRPRGDDGDTQGDGAEPGAAARGPPTTSALQIADSLSRPPYQGPSPFPAIWHRSGQERQGQEGVGVHFPGPVPRAPLVEVRQCRSRDPLQRMRTPLRAGPAHGATTPSACARSARVRLSASLLGYHLQGHRLHTTTVGSGTGRTAEGASGPSDGSASSDGGGTGGGEGAAKDNGGAKAKEATPKDTASRATGPSAPLQELPWRSRRWQITGSRDFDAISIKGLRERSTSEGAGGMERAVAVDAQGRERVAARGPRRWTPGPPGNTN